MTKIKPNSTGGKDAIVSCCNFTETSVNNENTFDTQIDQQQQQQERQQHGAVSPRDIDRTLANIKVTQKRFDYDLRPKFAILKHKSEILTQLTTKEIELSSTNVARPQAALAITPAWFFNIPTTRSPFPEFESKLPVDDNEVAKDE